jgi:hypothetical protein
MRIWWCNQSDTWEWERPAGVVCSSEETPKLTFRKTVGEVTKGDIIVHYRTSVGVVALSHAKEDGRHYSRLPLLKDADYGCGWRFRTAYLDLTKPIPKEEFAQRLVPLIKKGYPIDRNGNIRQGYFFPFDMDGLTILLDGRPDLRKWVALGKRGKKTNQKNKLKDVALEINRRAKAHPFGALQKIRTVLKGLQRPPTPHIFTSLSISETWAFHFGGRSELQFNIGIEGSGRSLRYGVAFSLKTSRTLPDISILFPKIKRFNDYISLNADTFSDMRMWHYEKEKRSHDSMPSPVAPELAKQGVFIFLGLQQSLQSLDYELILDGFYRLLPLYKYVEDSKVLEPITAATKGSFKFQSGCTSKKSSTAATLAQEVLDIDLRHNQLQKALHHRLVRRFGKENVGAEIQSGVGTSIDVAVKRRDGEYWFYEIKTGQSPRACLRQALGQLLEYAFWPGSQVAKRLVVVGESALDDDAKSYLRILKEKFALPLDYEQIST